MSEQLTEETIRQMAEQEVARYTSRIKELDEERDELKEVLRQIKNDYRFYRWFPITAKEIEKLLADKQPKNND